MWIIRYWSSAILQEYVSNEIGILAAIEDFCNQKGESNQPSDIENIEKAA